eukprot:GILK01000607.1.p1 GENE.GILK01000607.1~~GILK01000607.1.p1  ORF type:complete len:463 (-),score=109.58 GILK01000607.1:68-1456(-)
MNLSFSKSRMTESKSHKSLRPISAPQHKLQISNFQFPNNVLSEPPSIQGLPAGSNHAIPAMRKIASTPSIIKSKGGSSPDKRASQRKTPTKALFAPYMQKQSMVGSRSEKKLRGASHISDLWLESNQDSSSAAALKLEVSLAKRLRHLNSPTVTVDDNGDQRLQVYRELFDEIISRDKIYGSLLNRVKMAYEHALQARQANGLLGHVDTLAPLRSNRSSSQVLESNIHDVVTSSTSHQPLHLPLHKTDVSKIGKVITSPPTYTPASSRGTVLTATPQVIPFQSINGEPAKALTVDLTSEPLKEPPCLIVECPSSSQVDSVLLSGPSLSQREREQKEEEDVALKIQSVFRKRQRNKAATNTDPVTPVAPLFNPPVQVESTPVSTSSSTLENSLLVDVSSPPVVVTAPSPAPKPKMPFGLKKLALPSKEEVNKTEVDFQDEFLSHIDEFSESWREATHAMLQRT